MPRRAQLAALGASAGLLLLIITWYLAFHVGLFERADQSIFSGFAGLHRPRVDRLANFIARLCDPKPYVYFAAVPLLVALARRRPRIAFAIGAVILGANVTTQVLKPLLAEPRASSLFGGLAPVGAGSWPSGHATAAMSLALCSVLAAPARIRPAVAALGATFAVAVSYSFLTLGWHYPSDVFGGFLVAGTWTLLVVGVLFTLDARRPRALARKPDARPPIREVLISPALAALGAVALAGLLALARPHGVVAYARAHEAFMIGAAAIAALGLTLATGVMLALRR